MSRAVQPIRPFWRYYGGKWRAVASGYYPAPKHSTIIEPFAGAAGYSLHHHDRDVVLVDLNPKIAAIWRWLIAASPSDVASLPPTIEGDVRDLDLPDGARWLLGFWCGSALGAPLNSPTSWRLNYPRQAWTPAIRARVADGASKIKHWRIIEGPNSTAPDVVATWFVDPPYVVGGSRYATGSRNVDFDDLAAWCRTRRGQTIVCEATGATGLPFRHVGTMQAANTQGRGKASEAVWIHDGARGAQGVHL